MVTYAMTFRKFVLNENSLLRNGSPFVNIFILGKTSPYILPILLAPVNEFMISG
jgi:hypothetical protein